MIGWKKKLNALLAVLCCAVFLAACGGEEGARVIFTTGFGRDEVFRLGDETCRLPEMMVVLTTMQNQYESVYGEEIWNTSLDGVTLEENVKDTVLAGMAQIKAMYLLARSRGVELDQEETELAEKAAGEYFSSLSDKEKKAMGATADTVRGLYKQYALADKVYQQIIKDVNPEISDDEARTITIQHILVRTGETDGNGKYREYSQEEKAAARRAAEEAQRLAADGEHSFEELAAQYSEDGTLTYSFGKGELDEGFERAAFQLETGEVSGVVESPEGYHIIKCISTFNQEETDANKLKILEQRKREVFGQEYDEFVESLPRRLNEKLWSKITLINDGEVTTSDFFDIYNKYLERD